MADKKVKAKARAKGTNQTRLSDADVKSIVKQINAGATQSAMAKKYNYEAGNISRIMNGQMWSEITGIKTKAPKARVAKAAKPKAQGKNKGE